MVTRVGKIKKCDLMVICVGKKGFCQSLTRLAKKMSVFFMGQHVLPLTYCFFPTIASMDDWHTMSKLDNALPYMQERGYEYASSLVPFDASAKHEGNADAFAKGDTLTCSVARFFSSTERVRRQYHILMYFKSMWCFERNTTPIPVCMSEIATTCTVGNDLACATWFWNTLPCDQLFAICCKMRKKNKKPLRIVDVVDFESKKQQQRRACVLSSSVIELFPLLRNYIFIHLATRYTVAVKSYHAAKVAPESRVALSVPYFGRGKWKDVLHFHEYCYAVSEGNVDAASLMEALPFIETCLRIGICKRFSKASDADDANKFVFYYL